MQSASTFLKIDEVQTVKVIETYLRNLCQEQSTSGILIGLSGGVDSAVLTALAVRSVGKDAVHVSFLYDRDSDKASERKARMVADWLGLELEVQNIEPALREREIYAPLIVRLAHFSPFLNRFLHRLYHLVVGETPFLSGLRAESEEVQGHKVKKSRGSSFRRHLGAAFNARHIYRREFLEKKAKANNWLLLGAANRSEAMVGWYVKDGIDDLPLLPLMGLYKTQIRQLASYLGVPEEIRSQAPSPDMMKGLTDEFALGLSYSKIDVALDYLEGGLSDEALTAMGITKKELDLVRALNRFSSWKRETEHAPAPVSGGAGNGLRITQEKTQ